MSSEMSLVQHRPLRACDARAANSTTSGARSRTGRPDMQNSPNILIVIADQLVADLTGAYGHPVVRTPNLERLAARGVRFDSAYCAYPVCSPSRSSMLSGRFASTNSAWDNATPIASDIP